MSVFACSRFRLTKFTILVGVNSQIKNKTKDKTCFPSQREHYCSSLRYLEGITIKTIFLIIINSKCALISILKTTMINMIRKK